MREWASIHDVMKCYYNSSFELNVHTFHVSWVEKMPLYDDQITNTIGYMEAPKLFGLLFMLLFLFVASILI